MGKVFYSKYKNIFPTLTITLVVFILIGLAIARQKEYFFLSVITIVVVCITLNILLYSSQTKKAIFYRKGLIRFYESDDLIYIYDYSQRSEIVTFLTGAKVVIHNNTVLCDSNPDFFYHDNLGYDYYDNNSSIVCTESLSICINDYSVSIEDMSSCESMKLLKYIKDIQKSYNFDLYDYEIYKDYSSMCTME